MFKKVVAVSAVTLLVTTTGATFSSPIIPTSRVVPTIIIPTVLAPYMLVLEIPSVLVVPEITITPIVIDEVIPSSITVYQGNPEI